MPKMPTGFFLIVMCILFNIGHGSTYISYLRIEQAKRLLIKGMLSFLVSGFVYIVSMYVDIV